MAYPDCSRTILDECESRSRLPDTDYWKNPSNHWCSCADNMDYQICDPVPTRQHIVNSLTGET